MAELLMEAAKLTGVALPFSLDADIETANKSTAVRHELEDISLSFVTQSEQIEITVHMREKNPSEPLADRCHRRKLFEQMACGVGVSCIFPFPPTRCYHSQKANIQNFICEKGYLKTSSRMEMNG